MLTEEDIKLNSNPRNCTKSFFRTNAFYIYMSYVGDNESTWNSGNAFIYRCQYVFGSNDNEICSSRHTPKKKIVCAKSVYSSALKILL